MRRPGVASRPGVGSPHGRCGAAARGGEPPRASIAPGARPCRASCRGRGAPAGKSRHAKLSACATCQAAHRGGEPPRAMRRGRARARGACGARERTRVGRTGNQAAHRADGAAARAGRPGGQASRPTAKPHERCARTWVMRGRNGHGAHAESFAGGVSVRPL